VREFARSVSGLDSPPEDLGDLTPAMPKRWRSVSTGSPGGRNRLALVRTVLRRDPRLVSGPVAEELARRVPAAKPSGKSYGQDERERVLLAARQQFRAAWMRMGRTPRCLSAGEPVTWPRAALSGVSARSWTMSGVPGTCPWPT
jgi:hypothetical protein